MNDVYKYTDKDGNIAFLGIFSKFNPLFKTDNEKLSRLITQFKDEYLMEDGKKIRMIDFYTTMRVVIENFIYSKNTGFSISLSNSYWTKLPSRYNPNFISYKKLKEVLNFLERRELIVVYKGYRGEKRSFNTRVKPNKELIDLIKKTKIKRHHITLNNKRERIVLKDEKKKPIDYDETNSIYTKRKFIKEYEEHLNGFDIRYKDSRLNFDITRIFNNSKFQHGGRFYSSYQSIPSADRREFLTCDGEQMVEFDYSGMHINLLYGRKGLPLYSGDVYTVEGYEEHRAVFKIVLQIAINAKNRKAAIQAMNRQLRIHKFKGLKAGELLDAFAKKHEPISDYFFSGIGVYLQYLDSRIVENIYKRALKAKIPVLGVHDSFITKKCFSEKLVKWMKAEAIKIGKVPLEVDRK